MATHNYSAYPISHKDLYRAGEVLRNSSSSFSLAEKDEWEEAYELLSRWRAMHALPLNTFQTSIRAIIKKNKLQKSTIVAQRLKRLPSILHKLQRFPQMQLGRMQDIGGIRVIVPTVKDVRQIVAAFKKAKWKHTLHNEKDYIDAPQASGYRSVHLIYSYKGYSIHKEYSGLHVEIQIRTRLQHIWATAVETIGTFVNHSLKSSQGPKEWLDYLKLVSAVFAIEEKTPIPQEFTNLDTGMLINELYEQTKTLNAFSHLESFHQAVHFASRKKFQNKYILLKLDFANKTGEASIFKQNQLDIATAEYGELEKKRKKEEDTVLVSSASLSELKKAYPNYFIDASEFIKQLKHIFKSYGLPEIESGALEKENN